MQASLIKFLTGSPRHTNLLITKKLRAHLKFSFAAQTGVTYKPNKTFFWTKDMSFVNHLSANTKHENLDTCTEDLVNSWLYADRSSYTTEYKFQNRTNICTVGSGKITSTMNMIIKKASGHKSVIQHYEVLHISIRSQPCRDATESCAHRGLGNCYISVPKIHRGHNHRTLQVHYRYWSNY